MNGITASRQELGTALEARGLRVSFDPYRIAPPAVLIVGQDPWVSPSRLVTRSRLLRWRVVAIAGLTDSDATTADLEDLVAALITAVALLDGWSDLTVDAPGTTDVGGAQYLAAVGRIDHATEV